jgi:hypothetical protein
MPTSLISTGVQFPDNSTQNTGGITITGPSLSSNLIANTPNPSFIITQFDSYTTYNISTTNGSVSRSGNIITYTPTVANTTANIIINGRTIGPFNVIPRGRDIFFNQTVLLLQGDGTNGAQNNTFLDNSTNNFTITRNGNTTQGTFTPFSQNAGYWSNFFNGTTDGLSVPKTNIGNLSGNEFTIECLIYLTAYATPSSGIYISEIFSSHSFSSFDGIEFYIKGTSSSFTTIGVYATTAGTIDREFSFTFSLNTWYHLALTRTSGGVYVIYVNGTSVGTFTNAATWTDPGPYTIGRSNLNGYEYPFPGYISNYRIVIGSVVYSSTFTPPIIPLTAITNTKLLTCQSNRFVDNSSFNSAVTRVGTPSVQPFSPFAPTDAYSTSVNGGSMYFDGTGDFLSGTSNAALNAGTGAFTFETWFYVQSFPYNATLMNTGTQTNGLQIGRRDSGVVDWGVAQAGVAWRLVSTTLPTTGQWNHMVVVRDGSNNMSLFLNGVRVATTSTAFTFTQNGFSVGSTCDGYFSSTRYVVGTAVYNPTLTTLTVPTAPLTAITNTSLLLNGTNAGIFDNAGKNNLETVGNAQVSTSVVKYGTGSMAFDGNGDYLTGPTSPQLAVGTGNFTIECWINPTGAQSQYAGIYAARNGSNVTLLCFSGAFSPAGATIDGWLGSVVACASNVTITSGAWTHLAFVRNNGVCVLYVNGVAGFYSTTNTTNGDSTLPNIGRDSFDPTNRSFNGYIDDLRITKGIARYTANFTPPTAAFVDQ